MQDRAGQSSRSGRRSAAERGRYTGRSGRQADAARRTTSGRAREPAGTARKPAGLALSLTLLATLITGACVSRLSTSHGPAVALAPEVSRTVPDPGNAGGQAAAWRPDGAAPHAVPVQHEPPAAAAGSGAVTINRSAGEWVSWALLNRSTGALTTGGDAGTNSTESMVKAWIAADYLQGLGGKEPSAADIDLLRRMIRDSDDQAAETLYLRRGNDAVINRLISTCGLTDTRVYHGWWSLTQISARDAARLGDCIADGKATNARWTAWLLGEMRQVRGEGRFGIIQERPGIAVKNGWTKWWDGTWHVNCLGVADGWALSVLIRYPAGLGLDHGAEVCRSVTRQLAP